MAVPLLTLLVVGLLIALAQAGAEEDRLGIVGGTEAAPHSRPYMVSLQEGRQHDCGGILIREDFVLTAAHCNGTYRVVLGAHSLHTRESTQQVRCIIRSYPHPQYKEEENDNDVMLLKLNKKAKLTRAVQVISLMNQQLPAGKLCSTAGWGDVDDNHTFPDKLQEVNTTILGRKKCVQLWRDRGMEITKQMVCATGRRPFQGFCTGDSGGPLVCDGKAAGIVSFSGLRCGDARTPDVYINILSYKTWIKRILKNG